MLPWLANWLVYVRYLEMRRDGKAGLTKMLQRKKLSLMDITIRWIPATNSYLSGENRELRAGGIILSNYKCISGSYFTVS